MQICHLLVILYLTSFSRALRLSPSPNLIQASQNTSFNLSSQGATTHPTPGKWPPTPHGRLEPPYNYGPEVYLSINNYGPPMSQRDSSIDREILVYLGLLLHDIEALGDVSDILSYTEVRKGALMLKYYPREILGTWGLRRCELALIVETIGGLAIVEGPRRIRSSYVVRDGREVGSFILGISVSRVPNAFGKVTG